MNMQFSSNVDLLLYDALEAELKSAEEGHGRLVKAVLSHVEGLAKV